MGALKGKPHRKFTQAEKLAYISEFQDAHISQSKFAKEHGLNLSMFERWMKEYAEQGEASLASHRDRCGNRYAALHTSKTLDEMGQLQFRMAKLEADVARLKKRIPGERKWFTEGIRYWQRQEFQIIEDLRSKYPVNMLCKVMGVNRSGYYKWRKRQGTENRYIQDRRLLTELILERHQKHKVWGHHSIAVSIRNDTGWRVSDNLVHKCCKAAGVKSKAKRYKYQKPGKESEIFPNLVRGCWAAARPLEIVVSDMTCIRCNGKIYEWVLFIDTFNNEIIAHSISAHRGDPKTYYNCLDQLCKRVKNVKEQTAGTVMHTDQGAVYSSRAFSRTHSNCNIIRSMSRAGTPTDNPIIESLNGWMKAELILDFGISKVSNLKKTLDQYVLYFNSERFAAALDYNPPIQYRTELGV